MPLNPLPHIQALVGGMRGTWKGRHASPQGWKSETSRMGMNVGPGTGIREALVSGACASEWSRSSLVTGQLRARGVYKRLWSHSEISWNTTHHHHQSHSLKYFYTARSRSFFKELINTTLTFVSNQSLTNNQNGSHHCYCCPGL